MSQWLCREDVKLIYYFLSTHFHEMDLDLYSNTEKNPNFYGQTTFRSNESEQKTKGCSMTVKLDNMKQSTILPLSYNNPTMRTMRGLACCLSWPIQLADSCVSLM